jgi:hypothetical protein
MKLAVMQPYFLPYIGYFQLIAAADKFVVYDNIEYTKRGWINRNRMLQTGRDLLFSLPLKSDSDYLDVRDRELSQQFDRKKLLNQIESAYRRAPQFVATFELVKRIVSHQESNLFAFIFNSIREVCDHLGITTEIVVSSDVLIDHELKGQSKVLALCDALAATTYINAIGGIDLYSKAEFEARGVDLTFIRSHDLIYDQFAQPFVPWLSIIDVLMFNPLETAKSLVSTGFDLI